MAELQNSVLKVKINQNITEQKLSTEGYDFLKKIFVRWNNLETTALIHSIHIDTIRYHMCWLTITSVFKKSGILITIIFNTISRRRSWLY